MTAIKECLVKSFCVRSNRSPLLSAYICVNLRLAFLLFVSIRGYGFKVLRECQ
jgi:hypothetical protein